MDKKNTRYTYADAGFNGFMQRSLGSNSAANTLRALVPTISRNINFDQMQVTGSLGDTMQTDGVRVERKGISFIDDSGVVIGRAGNLDD